MEVDEMLLFFLLFFGVLSTHHPFCEFTIDTHWHCQAIPAQDLNFVSDDEGVGERIGVARLGLHPSDMLHHKLGKSETCTYSKPHVAPARSG